MMALEQARKLVAGALDRSVEEVAGDGTVGGVPGWDSLGHMHIVLSLVAALGRSLAPQEILAVKSIADVAALLDRRGNGLDGAA